MMTKTAKLFWTFFGPPLYLSWRVYWSNRMPISDCDEVYNYWEPLHFLLYNNHNTNSNNGEAGGGGSGGQQTWEYAHEYALRTYAYLEPLRMVARYIFMPILSSSSSSLPTTTTTVTTTISQWLVDYPVASLYKVTNDNGDGHYYKLPLFWWLRASLGLTMGLVELVWLWTLSQKLTHSSNSSSSKRFTVSFWTGVLLWSGAGMNHAAAAFLPSSTWMAVFMLCNTLFWWENQPYRFCFVAVTATLAIGWPFGVVLLMPMGLVLLWQQTQQQHAANGMRLVGNLLLWTAAVTVVVQGIVMYLDAQQYGRWTSATWNILKYNAAGGGDELYGVEPITYYIKNLLLNWNIVALLGAMVILPLTLSFLFFDRQHKLPVAENQQYHQFQMLTIGTFLPMYLWFLITMPRPHKEERFLFPIYPLLCLGAVWTVDATIDAMGRVLASLSRRKQVSDKWRWGLHAVLWTAAVILSLSRTMALSKYYTAPLTIYAQLGPDSMAAAVSNQTTIKDDDGNNNNKELLVCTCGEWYRFPSSFYLPFKNMHLAFLQSSFHGQLPQRFSKFGSKPQSQKLLQPFNDQNLEQPERYVQPSDCDWVVDLEGSDCFSNHQDFFRSKQVEIVARAPFLNAEATTTLHRILYIPYLHEKAVQSGKVQYYNYVLAKV